MTRLLDAAGNGSGDQSEIRRHPGRRRTPRRMFRPSVPDRSAFHAWAESLEERTLLAAPILFLGGGTTVDRVGNPLFVPGSQPITLLKPVTAITTDSNLVSAVVTITNPLDSTALVQNELIGFSAPLGEVVSNTQIYDPAAKTETLTLTFQAGGLTGLQTLAILQSLTYVDLAVAATTDRLLTFQISNVTLPNAPLANARVKFAASNVAPLGSLTPAGVNQLVGAGTVTLGLSALTFDPVEDGQSILGYTVSKVPGPTVGTVVKNGTIVALAAGDKLLLAELQSLQFVPLSATSNGSDTFVFSVQDNGGTVNSGHDTTIVTVPIVVNSPPVLNLTNSPITSEPITLATNFFAVSAATVTQPGTLNDYTNGYLQADLLNPIGAGVGGSISLVSHGNIDVTGSTVSFSGLAIGSLSTATPQQVKVTFTATTTTAAAAALIQAIQYVNSSQDPVRSQVVRFTLNNGQSGQNTSSPTDATVTIHRVNNPPVLTVPTSSVLVPIIVSSTSTTLISGSPVFSVTDPDAENGIETVIVSVGHGTVTLTGSGITNNGTASATITGTPAQISIVLGQGVTYAPSSFYAGIDSITVLANDAGKTGDPAEGGLPDNSLALTDTKVVSLYVPATLYLGGGTIVDRVGNPIFVPGSQPITLLKPVTSITTDSNLVSAVVTITNPLDNTTIVLNELIGFSDPLNVVASNTQIYDPAAKTETLTLTFKAGGLTVPQTLAILQSLTYVDKAVVATTDRLLTFQISTATGPNAPLAKATVKFAASNLPPVSSFIPAGVNQLVGAGTSTLGLTTLTFDPVEDGQSIVSYTVSKIPDPALGTVVGSGNVTVSAGDALTLAQLQSLQFVPKSATARGSDTFVFVVKDSGGSANGGNDSTNVVVPILVNTRPVLTPVGPSFDGIPVGQPLATNPGETVFKLYSALNVTEPGTPAPGQGIAVTGVDNSHGTWMYFDTSLNKFVPFGTPTPTGARLLAATAAEKILFDPVANFNGTATITFAAWDKLTGVNEGTASTTGGPTSSFSTTFDTASIEVNTAPRLTAASATVPTILSNPLSNPGETVSQFVTSLGGAFTDIDPGAFKGIAIVGADNSNGQWQYLKSSVWTSFPASLSDANAFLLSANPGVESIRFVPNSNFNGKATFTFRAWDQITGTSEQNADASVNGGHTAFSSGSSVATVIVNSPPVLGVTNSPITSEPVTPASNFFAVSTATVTQPDSLNNFNGGFFQADLQSLAGPGVGGSIALVNMNMGGISVSGGTPGSTVSFSGQPIGNITTADGQHIKVSFTGTTTTAAAAALIQAVEYVNPSQDPARTQVVRFTVDNGQGGQSTSSPVDATVSIHRVNNAPALTVPISSVLAPISVSINTATLVSGSPAFSLFDPDAQSGIETVTVSVGHGTVTFTGSGITNNGTASATITGTVAAINTVLGPGVTYTPVQGFTSIDTITVVANDQGNTGDPAEGGLPDKSLPLLDTQFVYLSVASTLSASAVATDLNNNPITTANAVLVGEPFNYTLTVNNANNSAVPVDLTDMLPLTLSPVPGTSLPSTTQIIPANGMSKFTFQVFATPAAVSDASLLSYSVSTLFTVTPKTSTDGPVLNVLLPSPVAYIQVRVGGDATVVAPGHYAVQEQVNQTRQAPFNITVGPGGTSIARAVTLTLSTALSTATPGKEYNGIFPSPVTLNPGNNFTTTVSITIPDNSAIEGTKTLNVLMFLQNPPSVGPQPTGRVDQAKIVLDILDGNASGLLVTTTDDNGDDVNPTPNSLRAAIKTANSTAIVGGNPLVITFQIPNGGNVITVKNNPLPALQHATVIDATPTPLYPQSISIVGTNTFDYGFTIWSSLASPGKGTTVRGLTFMNFKKYAIDILGPGGSGAGEGDVVISGDTFKLNGGGVLVSGSTGGTIGGPGAGDGNTFTLNTGTAIAVSDLDTPNQVSAKTAIQGNLITSNFSGVVITNSSNVKVGGGYDDTAQSLGNLITDNSDHGVFIVSGNNDSIRFNTIARDGGKGIDIAASANSVNAATILQPSIVGASAFVVAGKPTSVTFQGTISQVLGSGFKVDFYVNDVTNPGGSPLTPIPQGQLFVSAYGASASTAPFSFSDHFLNNAVKADQYVTAVVTDASGNSSTFSKEFRITNGLVVTNTDDSGTNSLRDAITNANTYTTVPTINFRLDPADAGFKTNGYWTIALKSALPAITHAVNIDGGGTANTLPNDDNAVITVRIDAGGQADAFKFANVTGPSGVRGLSIVDYTDAGILIDSGTSSITLAGNFLGISPDKTLFKVNGNPVVGKAGVRVNNATGVLIGGARDDSLTASADRNVIAGNTMAGVIVTGGSGVTVSNNFLGFVGFDQATHTALVAVSNGEGVDITLASPSSPISVLNNVISGNLGYGVNVTGGQGAVSPSRFALIAGNQIGVALDPTGGKSLKLGNGKGGILVNLAGGVVIGGTASIDRNVIGANKSADSADKSQGSGVTVVNSTGVRVVGNTLGGSGLGLGNAFDGVYAKLSPGVVIASNVSIGNAGDGIDLIASPDALVGGNKIGLDDNSTAIANGGDGVLVSDSANALIGDFSSTEFGPVTWNVISGNGVANSPGGGGGGSGVHLVGTLSTGAKIQNNKIGTDKDGAKPVSNLFDGVKVEGAGSTLAAMILGNTISGNTGNGIHVINTSGVTISGNKIGNSKTLHNGTDSAPGNGVLVDGATTGIMITSANVIVANTGYGIKFIAVSNSAISGNQIGTDLTGATGLGNTLGGVRIENASNGDTVSSNTISGNQGIGLDVNGGTSLTVNANTIGLTPSGSGERANTGDGIAMAGAFTPTIDANFIGANTGYGINLTDTPNAQIDRNMIGTDLSGSQAHGNTLGGVRITASNGSTVSGVAVTGNTISANGVIGSGAGLFASHTVGLIVANNMIGLNFAGTSALGNQGEGVSITDAASIAASPTTITGNLIGGNKGNGLFLSNAPFSQVQSNRIGTGADGLAVFGNTADGIRVDKSDSVVIGDPSGVAAPNIIINNGTSASAGGNSGVEATDPSTTNLQIVNNVIGVVLTPTGWRARGNAGDGIALSSGVPLARVTGNSIGGNRTNGVEITDSSATLTLNTIGMGPNGIVTAGNTGDGVHISGASAVTVGNLSPANGNEIGSNSGAGVMIVKGTGIVVVVGNFIGTSRNLGMGLGNIKAGVDVEDTPNVFVSLNVIAGNTGSGVFANFANGLIVTGNGIGTTLDGTSALGNGGDGIQVDNTTGALIGSASDPNLANWIDNNGKNGIEIGGKDPKVTSTVRVIRVVGNKIGVGGGTNTNPGNTGDGVKVTSVNAMLDPTNPVVGNRDVGILISENVLVNNLGNGVDTLNASGTVLITRNWIGTPIASGYDSSNLTKSPADYPAGDQGNHLDGVRIDTSSSVALGTGNSTGNKTGNNIAFNKINGVEVSGVGSGNMIDHNAITHNGASGVLLNGTAAAGAIPAMVQYNSIGNVSATTTGFGNTGPGVTILSGSNTVDLNMIGGNQSSGVLISTLSAAGNVVSNNTIGGQADGVGNRGDGISLVAAGSGNQIQNNTIIGNSNNGVLISQTSNTMLSHNFIGTDMNGAGLDGNGGAGVNIVKSDDNTVDGNWIAANHSSGVQITENSAKLTGNKIQNNSIGLLIVGTSGVPTPTPRGNTLVGVLVVNSSKNVLKGNIISQNGSHGAFLFGTGGANTVAGNYIGTYANANSTEPFGNRGDGVVILDSSFNVIGGRDKGDSTHLGDRNVIAGSGQSGVDILGLAQNNEVLGNFIGVSATGQAFPALANTLNGVAVTQPNTGPLGNIIGEVTDPKPPDGYRPNGNFIGNNNGSGVFLNYSVGTVVANNFIGTTDSGFTNPAKNTLSGITLSYSNGCVVQHNQIANNGVDGIDLLQSSGNVLTTNTVLNNNRDGLRLEEESGSKTANYVVSGNTIAGNAAAGVELRTGATNNQISGNTIGLFPDMFTPLANKPQPVGVLLDSVGGNVVGWANLISGNTNDDVQIKNNRPAKDVTEVLIPGNYVLNNFIGTDRSHAKAVPLPANDSTQIGVYLLNSANNMVYGNVVSGHPLAGIEVFGSLSYHNLLQKNIVGPGVDIANNPTGPVLVDGSSNPLVYSLATRQQNGIWLNDAGTLGGTNDPKFGNMVLGNTVLGNETGVLISGANAAYNTVKGNQIGQSSTTNGVIPDLSGLGNFFGLKIDGASNNLVGSPTNIPTDKNTVSHNVSVGIYLNGPLTTHNSIQGNLIDSNGGYGVRNSTDNTFVKLTGYVTGSEVFGTGIYVDGALNNIIGATASVRTAGRRGKQTYSGGNTITNNVQSGIFLFDVSASASNPNTLPNSILGNTITGKANSKTPTLGLPSEYGIFLFNSISNLTAAPITGASGNVVTRNWIANFREFTGAVPPQDTVPAGFAPPATTIMSLATTSPAVKRTPRGGVPIVRGFGPRR